MNKEKKRFNLKKYLIFLLIVLVIGFSIFFAGMKFASKDNEPEITSSSLYSYLNEITELNVLEYKYSKVGKFENSLSINGWTIPLTKKDFLLTYSGELKAGVNLEEAKIDLETNKIIVHLPSVEITSNVIDEESIEVYDENSNIFNPIKVSDYTKFATSQKDLVEEEAIEDGLLSEASTKAVNVVKNLLLMIPDVKENYEIEVTFK